MARSIHFHTTKGWMNDPNGFIYYKGEYHLFYQYFPYATQWGTICWGHATSKDLVNWDQQEIALFPSLPEDQNGCFSGSAVEMGGQLRLFYTGVHYEEVDPTNINKCIPDRFTSAQLTVSSPDGHSFDNFADKTVIIPPLDDPALGDRVHTRDPKVWHGHDGWYMTLGSNVDRKQGEVLFYKSYDLLHWTYVNRMLMDPSYGWMCECPDMFTLETGDTVLLASMMGYLGQGRDESVCFTAHFEEATCDLKLLDGPRLVDYGRDFYAAQTTTDQEGRRVMIGWMRMPEPVADEWIGMFCAPRLVEVKNGHVYTNLHPNVRNALLHKDLATTEHRPYLFATDLSEGNHINVGGLRIWQEGHQIHVDRSSVYRARKGYQNVHSVTPEVAQTNKVEILVHGHLVEIYVNDGQYVISNIVYDLGGTFTTDANAEITVLGL